MKFFDASRYASPLRKALDKKENAPRNLRFETLETRSLLSVTPLDNFEAVAGAEIAPAQLEETPLVDLTALSVSNATTDGAPSETPSTVVTTEDDVVDAFDGEIRLREALEYAEAGATIAFAADVETITLAGSQLEITKAITIDGGEKGVTIDGAQKSRVFFIDATDGTVALQNLTVAGGKEYRAGGGYVDGSEAPLPDDANLGGGVYVNDDATATFANVTISGNEAKNSGGVYLGSNATATFTNVTISGNEAKNNGGVYVGSNATATFTNVEISGNAARGAMGGVYVYSGVKATFTDVAFTENTASVDSGGAAYVRGEATFTNVAIVGNAARDGAGVQVSGDGTANFTNVAIIGNFAPYNSESFLASASAGGVLLSNWSTATFTNVTIAENRSGYGGGLYVGAGSTATFTNVTIADNETSEGNLYNSGTVNFYNSVLGVKTGVDLINNGTANAYNTLSSYTDWTNANEEGVTNYVYDATQPLFNDAENGDYTLAAGSQAINKGNDAYLADEITTDLAGNPRFNGAVDLGAYEDQALFTPTNLTVSKLDPETRQVTFAWDDVDLETEYLVLLWTVDGQVQTVLPANTTSWTPDVEFPLGSAASVSIMPKNADGVAPVPALLTFAIEDVPTQPTNLTATVDDAFNATLTWTDDADAIGYEVAVLDENGEWQVVAELPAGSTTWTHDAPFDLGPNYQYAVRAVNAYNASEWTVVKLATEAKSTIVTTEDDVVNPLDGKISLREAIEYAEAGATIAFADGVETITLAGSELRVTKALAFDGGENGVTLDANWKSRVFYLDARNETFAFNNLTVTGGYLASHDGAGVQVSGDGTANFTNVAIIGNFAPYNSESFLASASAGGVLLSNWSTATFTNVTIAENRSGYGGGLYVAAGTTATFTNVTIADNETSKGNLYNGGTVNFYNSVLGVKTGVDLINNGTANARNTLSSFTEWSNANEEGVANYVYDETQPLFAKGSYVLAAGSQAIGKGNDAYLADEDGNPIVTTDMAGNPRVNGAVDLGAYEDQTLFTPTNLTLLNFDPETCKATFARDDVDLETEYLVLLWTPDGQVQVTLPANTTSWTPDVEFTLGSAASVSIMPKNADGVAPAPAVLTFTVEDVPAQPTDLTATVDDAFNATLTWTDAATTETGYEVAILDENGEWQVVAELPVGATEWTTDAALAVASSCQYAVRAVNQHGVSDWATVELATEAKSTVVTTAEDVVDPFDGEISLREAIQYAEAGDTIVFADDVATIVSPERNSKFPKRLRSTAAKTASRSTAKENPASSKLKRRTGRSRSTT